MSLTDPPRIGNNQARPGFQSNGEPIPSLSTAHKQPTTIQGTDGTDGTNGVFGAGTPLVPQLGVSPRARDFVVSENTVITPRAYETSTKTLRAFANIEIVRLCIETRKDQVEGLSWSIKAIDDDKGKDDGTKNDPGIAACIAFWEKPDGYTDFSTWLRASLEDLFVGDWATWEMRRLRNGKLFAMEVLPGDTIHPMVDDTGRRPRGPNDVAYQQVIKGRPWYNFTNADLLYVPRNPRPGHNYGFSPVEQIIVTINTYMRRQAAQLAYFSEGNTPAGFITGPEGWTTEQTKEFQSFIDQRIAGNTGAQAKLLVMPNGAKYESFKDAPLKDDFDEWLARIVTFAFSLAPTPFIKSMNRSTAETDKERAQAEGLQPIKKWWKRVADHVIQNELGYPGLEWAWDDEIDIDPALQSAMDDRDVKNGTRTPDEIRERRGDEAYPNGVGAKPLIYTGTGAVLLEEAIKPPEPPPPQLAPFIGDPNAPPPPNGAPPVPPKPGGKAGVPSAPAGKDTPPPKPPPKPAPKPVAKAAGSTLRKIEPITPDRARPRRAAHSLTETLTTGLQAIGDAAAAHVAKQMRNVSKVDQSDTIDDIEAEAASIAAGVPLTRFSDLRDEVFTDLFDVVEDSAKEAIARVGVKTDKELFGRVDKTSADWASERAAELVSVDGDMNIIDATRAAIRDTISKGLTDGLSIPEIADAIQESRAFTPERAALIANTEVRRANSEGVLIGFRTARDLGITIQKQWETAGDDDVEQECEDNEDQGPIDLDDDFLSGDSAPPAHPNCRCNINSYTDNSSSNSQDDGEADD